MAIQFPCLQTDLSLWFNLEESDKKNTDFVLEEDKASLVKSR